MPAGQYDADFFLLPYADDTGQQRSDAYRCGGFGNQFRIPGQRPHPCNDAFFFHQHDLIDILFNDGKRVVVSAPD